MGINIRTKGAEGEREIARVLNGIVTKILAANAWPLDLVQACSKGIQRNQNQSAVGGNDLSNCYGLSIEVKRQESLYINTWWAQCVASASRNREIPVLVYRKNYQSWGVVMYLYSALPKIDGGTEWMGVRAQLDWDDFQTWFERWVIAKLRRGEYPRV